MFMHSPCIRTPFSIYLLYLKCVGTFLIVSFFPSLFCLRQLCLWHLSLSQLCPRTLCVLGHHLPLILLLLIFGFVMRMLERTSRRNFLDEVFIRNTESFWRTSPTLTYPMSFRVRVGSHCVTSRSLIHLC